MIRYAKLPPGSTLAHPDAVAQAKALEAHGYEQVEPHTLKDQEDVVGVAGHDGTSALVRYHRVGQDVDAHGRRSEHVLEAWPGSAHSDMLPYAKTTQHAIRTQAGEPVPRLALFRTTHPEHAGHGLPLYAARERLG